MSPEWTGVILTVAVQIAGLAFLGGRISQIVKDLERRIADIEEWRSSMTPPYSYRPPTNYPPA